MGDGREKTHQQHGSSKVKLKKPRSGLFFFFFSKNKKVKEEEEEEEEGGGVGGGRNIPI
jgi:hypothetical protein